MDWSWLYILAYFIVFLSVFLIILYYYGTLTYGYWKNLGVDTVRPKFPFFGNSFESIFSIKPYHEVQLELYDAFKGKPFGGIFSFRRPSLFVRDPSLVEAILIKDFTNFYNRGRKVDLDLDPLMANIVFLEDEMWKCVRNKLSPAFTSGKLRYMHQHLLDCTDLLVDHIKGFAKEGNSSFELKEVMSMYSLDVIASCAFGIHTDILGQPDSPFKIMGKQMFQISFLGKLRGSLQAYQPWILRVLKWKGVSAKLEKFFTNTIRQTLEFRKTHNVERYDFVHLLNELRETDLQNLQNGCINNEDKLVIFDEKVIVSNAFAFFVAGYETTSSTLSYSLYELSMNQDIQETLYCEIISVLKKYDGQATYDAIKEMTYLNQVIDETLRLYPPAAATTRVSRYPYKIPGSSLVLPKGALVHIPIYSLQHDPDYFPDPYKFQPDRFSKDNKEKIKKCTYLPFGDGPRICIGMRFAKMEIKVALAKILLKYKLFPSEKMKLPLKYSRQTVFLVPIGGLWVRMQERDME